MPSRTTKTRHGVTCANTLAAEEIRIAVCQLSMSMVSPGSANGAHLTHTTVCSATWKPVQHVRISRAILAATVMV